MGVAKMLKSYTHQRENTDTSSHSLPLHPTSHNEKNLLLFFKSSPLWLDKKVVNDQKLPQSHTAD